MAVLLIMICISLEAIATMFYNLCHRHYFAHGESFKEPLITLTQSFYVVVGLANKYVTEDEWKSGSAVDAAKCDSYTIFAWSGGSDQL
eukprot:scaffold67586_cov16-Prasinocladus_malaysianus.AAC.1